MGNESNMSAQFKKAVEIVQSLPKDGPIKPTQEEQLKFYSLYKQATLGDVNTERPGMFDFVGKAKWDAWKSVEGKSQAEAQEEYCQALKDVLAKADNEESKEYLKQLEAAASA